MLDNALTTDIAQQRRNNGQFATTSQAPLAAVLSRVNEILPQFRSQASETEKLRRMHPHNRTQLTETGVFNVTRPADVGGYEADDHIVTEVSPRSPRMLGGSLVHSQGDTSVGLEKHVETEAFVLAESRTDSAEDILCRCCMVPPTPKDRDDGNELLDRVGLESSIPGPS
jgi:hypothetical protein